MEKNLENGIYVPFGYVMLSVAEYKDLLERALTAEAENRVSDQFKYYKSAYFDALADIENLRGTIEALKGEKENA